MFGFFVIKSSTLALYLCPLDQNGRYLAQRSFSAYQEPRGTTNRLAKPTFGRVPIMVKYSATFLNWTRAKYPGPSQCAKHEGATKMPMKRVFSSSNRIQV